MARAMATPWRSPPDSWPTNRQRREDLRGEADLAHQPFGFLELLPGVEEAQPADDFRAHEDVAHDRLLDAEGAVLEDRLDAGIARTGAVPVSDGLARMRISPAVGLMTPARILIKVDLPAPLSPIRPTTSPRSTCRSTRRGRRPGHTTW